MVDPVNNRGYYEYRRVNTKAGTGMENGEKFSLEQGNTEKDSEKKGEEKTKVEADGVIAEFSGQSRGQYGGSKSRERAEGGETPGIDFGQTVERARGFIGGLWKSVTELFGSIRNALWDFWNSDSPGAAGDSAGTEEGAQAIDVTEMSQELEGETGLDVIEAEGVVERSADTKLSGMEGRRAEAERYLEDRGQMERYVKNSDLLTYYDRSGRIVQMNGADKSRILHGDTRTSRGV